MNVMLNAPTTGATQVKCDGIFVCWDNAAHVARAVFSAAIGAAGLILALPERRTAVNVLRTAIDALIWERHRRMQVRPLKRDGWTVERETRGDTSNTHESRCYAKVDPITETIETDLPAAKADRVRDHFIAHRDDLSDDQLTILLRNVCGTLSATQIKAGVYWIPGKHAPTLHALKHALKDCGASRLHLVHQSFDADSLEAITFAFVRETESAVEKIQSAIDNDELGVVALGNRRDACTALAATVAEYEQTLSVALPQLHSIITAAETAAATAQLAALTANG